MPRLMSRVRVPFPALLRDLGACSARCSWVQAVRNSNPWWNCVVHFLYERTPLPIVPTRQRGFYSQQGNIEACRLSNAVFRTQVETLKSVLRSAIHIPQSAFSLAPYPSGKGEVCKTFIRRFESARRLSQFRNVECGMRIENSYLRLTLNS